MPDLSAGHIEMLDGSVAPCAVRYRPDGVLYFDAGGDLFVGGTVATLVRSLERSSA